MKFYFILKAVNLFALICFCGYICGIIFILLCQFQEDFIFDTDFKDSYNDIKYKEEYMVTSKGYKEPTINVVLTAIWNAMILLTNN